MALGQQLREARLRKNLTTTQVAAATQIHTRTLEDLEQENFSRLSAAVYAKGFIRLYARYLGLDPQPLIQDYMSRFARGAIPALKAVHQEAEQDSAGSLAAESLPEGPEPSPESEPKVDPPPAMEEHETPATAEPVLRPLPDLRSAEDDLTHVGATAMKEEGTSSDRDRHNIHTHLHRHRWLKNRPAGSFLKYIPLALGLLLLLVFVISSLSRLHGKKPAPETVVAPLNEPKEELRLVTDPPAPYLD